MSTDDPADKPAQGPKPPPFAYSRALGALELFVDHQGGWELLRGGAYVTFGTSVGDTKTLVSELYCAGADALLADLATDPAWLQLVWAHAVKG